MKLIIITRKVIKTRECYCIMGMGLGILSHSTGDVDVVIVLKVSACDQ